MVRAMTRTTAVRSEVPRTTLTTRAIAETRTPSAMARVTRKVLATKIAGQQQEHDEHATGQIAEDKLEKGEIAGVGDGGRPDDGERRGFGGDNRESQGPPRRGFAAEEIVARALLRAAEANAQRGDAEKVGNDNRQIDGVNSHQGLAGTRREGNWAQTGMDAKLYARREVRANLFPPGGEPHGG